MGLVKCNLVLPAALMLCQGSLFAATPLAPAPLKALAAEAQGEEKKAFEGGLEALERRLGGLAADHLKAIAADTEIRMNGYLGDFKLLTTGIYYGNAYAEALKAKGQTERYNHLRDRGAFYHGFASPKHFTLEPSLLSPTGKTPLQFLLKPGVAPSAALDSFRTGIALLDCGSTAQLSYYEALRGVLGQDKFDALFAAGSRTPLRLCPTFMANCPITPLFRLVPSDAPFRRGQYVSFAGIPDYQVKHLNGDATNFNVLCEDPGMPGSERFIGLGLSGLGMDRSGIDQVFVDAYNADPVAWDIFPETLATSIRNSYQPEALAASAGMAGARTTLDAFQKTGGARLAQRVEFRAERVAALMAATHERAQALLAAWNQELAK